MMVVVLLTVTDAVMLLDGSFYRSADFVVPPSQTGGDLTWRQTATHEFRINLINIDDNDPVAGLIISGKGHRR